MKKIKINTYCAFVFMLLISCSGTVFGQNSADTISIDGFSLRSGMTNEKNDIELPAGISDSKRNLVGAVSKIDGEALRKYPDALLSNTLQGKLLGLGSIQGTGGLADNPSKLFIRGNQRGSNNFIVTIVDGMERPIDNLLPEEIESIEILKDATSKIMYGARAANGVLLITTKHGTEKNQVIRTNLEYGFGQVTRSPEYLDSYDYARLYNQARTRDGLVPLYSEQDIEGYKNSNGPNDFRYPNVDYGNYFLNNYNSYQKISLELSGGNQRTRYAFVAGYTGTDGLEKVGIKPDYKQLNLRGNLDIKINDMISGFIGLASQFDYTKRGSINSADVYNNVNSTRPNEFPLIIDENIVKADTMGLPALGASFTRPDNLFGILQYGGYAKDQKLNGQTNFGLKFNFEKFIKGLSGKAYFTLDNSFYGQESLTTTAATYAQRYTKNPGGLDSLILVQLTKTDINDDVKLSNTFNRRSAGWISNVNYTYHVGRNALNADFSSIFLKQEITGTGQDVKTANYILHGKYERNEKYLFESTLSYMGSSKFVGDNRFKLFYAGGLGWIISEEDFFKSLLGKRIDYLKLKTSAGLLGYDAATDYHLNQNRWISDGSHRFNKGNNLEKIRYDVIGNPDLEWEKSRQINVGLEALAFNGKFFLETNYFNELSFDQLQKVDAIYSSLYGGLIPYTNWGKVKNQGVELEIRWTEHNSEGLGISIGGNMLYSKNKILKADEINYPDEYLKITNRPSDAMFGYISQGLFGKDVQLEGHPVQSFGNYGEGDVAYKDLNNDGIVNELDRQVIGNSFPRFVLGIDFHLIYKKWQLYVLGTANLGVKSWLNNSYYWINGEDKYSVKALDSYDSQNNPSGKYPALTTTTGSNNFLNSDLWIENSGFFRLKNVELSYTLSSIQNKSVKIFCRGTNLFVLSKIKDLDPEALNAGLQNYPILRNLTAGVSISF